MLETQVGGNGHKQELADGETDWWDRWKQKLKRYKQTDYMDGTAITFTDL